MEKLYLCTGVAALKVFCGTMAWANQNKIESQFDGLPSFCSQVVWVTWYGKHGNMIHSGWHLCQGFKVSPVSTEVTYMVFLWTVLQRGLQQKVSRSCSCNVAVGGPLNNSSTAVMAERCLNNFNDHFISNFKCVASTLERNVVNKCNLICIKHTLVSIALLVPAVLRGN